MLTIRTLNLNNPRAAFRNFLLAAAATIALIIASLIPTSADARPLHIGDADDLLEELVAMDASDIAALQADLVEARGDIEEAISDIADAKEDVKETAMGAAIANVAFNVAQVTVKSASGMAITKARKALDKTETLLGERRGALGDAEFQETRGAIIMIRGELAEIERALDALTEALRKP